ncbi:MAG: TonB family protein [Bacteroidota bacterium]
MKQLLLLSFLSLSYFSYLFTVTEKATIVEHKSHAAYFSQNCIPEDPSAQIFQVVEDMPRFPGCEDIMDTAERKQCASRKMLDFVYDNLLYPQKAYDNRTEGTAVVRFIVEKEGCVSNATILRGLGDNTDQEVLRVINLMNTEGMRWSPGKQRENPVRVYFNLPVKFIWTENATIGSDDLYNFINPCDTTIISGRLAGCSIDHFNVFPNPVVEVLNISFLADASTMGSINIYDTKGSRIIHQTQFISAGANTERIPLGDVDSGHMIIAIHDADGNVLGACHFLKLEER